MKAVVCGLSFIFTPDGRVAKRIETIIYSWWFRYDGKAPSTQPPLLSLKHKRVVFVTTRFDVGELTRARRFAASLLCFLFLIFLYFDNFAAFVKTAVGTNRVRKAHGPAVGAGCEVARNQRVVRAAVIAAALRVFALWMWGH